MDQPETEKKIAYPDSNRVGRFQVLREVLIDGGNRPWLQALFGLCVPLEVREHESGRGKEYTCASELFQPLAEGEEIPEYRIECERLARPFTAEELKEQRVIEGGGFRFYAVRKIILRVPPASIRLTPQTLH